MSDHMVLDRQGIPRSIDEVLAGELIRLRTTHKQKRIDELEAENKGLREALLKALEGGKGER